MKYLFTRTFIGIAMMTLLCGAAVAMRYFMPYTDKELIPGLGACNGVPCYWGVTPDKTSLLEAKKLWMDAPLRAEQAHPNHFWIEKYKTAFLSQAGANGLAGGIVIGVTSHDLAAGDVISQLGTPCYVVSLHGTVIVAYEYMQIFFVSYQSGNTWVFKPTSPAIEIHLLSGDGKSCFPTPNSTLFDWRGFAQYN